MNNTTEFTPPYVVTAVGVAYITTVAIIIPLHIICSCLMWKDKDMRNPTFQFIINLSIADINALVPLGLYEGVIIVFRLETIFWLDRFMAFWVLGAWYVNCVMFIFIAFSRWISMTRPHLVKVVFTKRKLYLFHLAPWVIFMVFYFYSTVLRPVPEFYFMPSYFTWVFAMDDPFGLWMYWHNFGFNLACAIVEMIFNVMSLKWVHATRKTIMSLDSRKNRRRETKLLIQCFIMGCIFAATSLVFTGVSEAGVYTPMACLGVEILWIFNHCVNPIVYLSVNSKLRKAFISLITCGKKAKTNSVAPVNSSNRTPAAAVPQASA